MSFKKHYHPVTKPRRKSGPKKGHKATRMSYEERSQKQDEFIQIYEQDGITLTKATKDIGVPRQVIYTWAESDPNFGEKFERIRFIKKGKSQEEWDQYHKFDDKYKQQFLELYEDVSYSVASTMDKINETSHVILTKYDLDYWQKTDPKFKEKYKALQFKTRPTLAQGLKLAQIGNETRTTEKKLKFLEVYKEKLFSITKACNAMGINRTLVTEWKSKDPDFRSTLQAIEEEKLDFIEDALFDEIDNRNIAAIIFAAKCKLKERGYIELPQQRTLTIEHKQDKAMIDAVVRAAELSSGRLFELPNAQKQISEEIVEAEYSEEENDKSEY